MYGIIRMMEKPKSPWSVPEGSPVAELEFQRRTLEDLGRQVRNFAKKNDITYASDKTSDTLSILPDTTDFDRVDRYVTQTLGTLNKMLEHHKKQFLFVLTYDDGKIVISASPRT